MTSSSSNMAAPAISSGPSKMSKSLSAYAAYVCAFVLGMHFLSESARADPVLYTSIGACAPVPVKLGDPLNCCLPTPARDPIRFQFPKVNKKTMRVRKPVHVVAKDPAYVKKYNLAYARMKALPASDPRSFTSQWKVHCSFCNSAFKQRRAPGGEETGEVLQVHFSWSFLPWHRMYLYYHERILADLIKDPTFALPFWNWDNTLDDDAGAISPMFLPGFKYENGALQDPNRNPRHMPPMVLHLGFSPQIEQNLTFDEVRYDNLAMMYSSVTTSVSAIDFMGGPYVAGGKAGESGSCENLHGVAHQWSGLSKDPAHPDNEDMGTFIYAGRDPLFYTHHGNVDRLWDVWGNLPDKETKGKKRQRLDYNTSDFKNSYYTFFDEKQDMVLVKISDSLDSAKLGYKYSDVSASDDLWINYKPRQPKAPSRPWVASDFPLALPGGNYKLTVTPSTYRFTRRKPTAEDLVGKQAKTIGSLAESVLIKNVVLPKSQYVRFDVFVNFPDADNQTPLFIANFVGTFIQLPNGVVQLSNMVSDFSDGGLTAKASNRVLDLRFGVDAAQLNLGILDDDQDMIVTIVLKGSTKTTQFPFDSIRQSFD